MRRRTGRLNFHTDLDNKVVTDAPHTFPTEKINYGSSLSLSLSLSLSFSLTHSLLSYRLSDCFQFKQSDVYECGQIKFGRRVDRKEVLGHLRRCKSSLREESTLVLLEELVLVLSRITKILKSWSVLSMAAFLSELHINGL